ncbi:MAG: hypothetical protein ACYDDP_09925 [Acidithiobacillus sp.]
MNRAARMQQEQADAWLERHENWDAGIPNPESFAQPLFICPENGDGREKYDIRRAVSEPGSCLPDLPNSPKRRKRRHKKAVNIQLIYGSSEQELFDAVEFNAAVSEIINRKHDYALSQYKGKYREVLSFFLLGIQTKEIAERTGKTSRIISKIMNGNAKRRTICLRQLITDLCEPSPPLPDINNDACCTAPVVAGVEVRHVC